MFCAKCGANNQDDAKFCLKCGVAILVAENQSKFSPSASNTASIETIPDGVRGWSWGAFLLNWIWAIGNRTWWGLLALIPYVGFIVAIWLGFKGREMAWKNRQWDDVAHFNRVQKKWSKWAVGIVLVVAGIGILAAVALPAYQDYVVRAKAANGSINVNETPDRMTVDQEEAAWIARLEATAIDVNKMAPQSIDAETRFDKSVAGPGRKFTYEYTLINVDRETLDAAQIENFTKTILQHMCGNPNFREFFENKTVIGFRYNDQNGRLFSEISRKPSDCGY